MRLKHIAALSPLLLVVLPLCAGAQNYRPLSPVAPQQVVVPSYVNAPVAYLYQNAAYPPQNYYAQQPQPAYPQAPMPMANPPQPYGGYYYAPPAPSAAVTATTTPLSKRSYTSRPDGFLASNSAKWALGGVLAAGAIAGGLIASGAFDSTSSDNNPEYDAQYGLSAIHANVAHAQGITGLNTVVAVIDSGMDVGHFEFAGRVVSGNGYDMINDQAGMPAVGQLNGHGTNVAGIIAANRNDKGILGVAYEAQILPIRILDAEGVGTLLDLYNALLYVKDTNASVVNLSLGPSDAFGEAAQTDGYYTIGVSDAVMAGAFFDAAESGKALIFAAGNSYRTTPQAAANPFGGGFYPFIKPANNAATGLANGAYRGTGGSTIVYDFSALQPYTIVVAAVDRDNNMATFSNRCGVAKDWCMVAPGVEIHTTAIGDKFEDVSGTSFAAPHVAGAAALLKQNFPHLTTQEIVEILLTSATDLGDVGVDAVFGHGLLNVEAAMAPLGATGVALTGAVSGPRAELVNTRLRYGRAFGVNAAGVLANQRLGFLDHYNRGYSVGLGEIVDTASARLEAANAMRAFDTATPRTRISNERAQLSYQFTGRAAAPRLTSAQPSEKANDSGIESLSFSTSLGAESQVTFDYKDVASLGLGFREGDQERREQSLNKDALANPYAEMANSEYSAAFKTKALGFSFRVASFFGSGEEDNISSKDDALNFGSQIDAAYPLGKDSELSLGFGSLLEGNSLLGSQGEGAFGLGSGTATVYSGAGLRLALDEDTTLRAAAYAGMTEPGFETGSLVSDISSLITSSFSAEITHENLRAEGDAFAINFAQPLRVESGHMDIMVPVARAATADAVFRNNFSQDLSADGRELDIGMNYMLPLENSERLSFGAIYRHDAGHVRDASDALGVMRWSKRF
jgi:subtilisin family serine protease